MRLGLLALAAILAIGVATVGALTATPTSRGTGRAASQPSRPPRVTATPGPPRLERAQVNRQDRVDQAHAARESRALDARPLLSEVPLELGPVTLDAVGLADDGHRTIISLTGPDRMTAERAYRQALAALGDRPTHYAARWIP